MQFLLAVAHDVNDLHAKHDKYIGNEATMTSPPEHFGAHDHRSSAVRQHQEIEQSVGELFGGHVIRVGTKRRMAPADIPRISLRPPPSAELRNPAVVDVLLGKRTSECRRVELWKPARAGHPAHVGEQFDPGRFQQADELFARPRRVADGVDGQRMHDDEQVAVGGDEGKHIRDSSD